MTYFNKEFLGIAQEFLLPSIPKEFNTIDITYTTLEDVSNLNKKGMITRLEAGRDKILAYRNKYLMFVDADVIFYKNFSSEKAISLLKNHDLLFQLNGEWPYNTGIWLARCTEDVYWFFNRWIDEIRKQDTVNIFNSDQAFLNKMLKEQKAIRHTHLPVQYSASHMDNIYLSYQTIGQPRPSTKEFGMYKYIPQDTILFHATGAYSIEEKKHVLTWAREQLK
jgi:hypothetical protein